MTEKRSRLNTLFTAVIFGAFGVGVIQALIVITAAVPLALAGMTVVAGGSVDQSLGWATFFAAVGRHLAIVGACTVVVLAAGYGARRTAMSPC